MIHELILFSICLFFVCAENSFAGCDEALDQRSMNQCAYERYEASDKMLNEKFNKIVACFKDAPVDKTNFVNAQRAWVKFRDMECAFEVSDDNGTMTGQLRAECQKSVTEQRIKDFDSFIECAGGEAGGVCPTLSCDFSKGKTPAPK